MSEKDKEFELEKIRIQQEFEIAKLKQKNDLRYSEYLREMKHKQELLFDKLKRKESSIAKLAKRAQKNNNLQKVLSKSDRLWIPSMASFRFLFLCSFLGFILVNPGTVVWVISFLIHNVFSQEFIVFIEGVIPGLLDIEILQITATDAQHQNFINIHAGIGAVLVGLAFFVAQSLINQDDPDKGRVLLYESYFFPLLTAEVLIFLMFLNPKVNLFGARLLIIILALFTVFSLAKTINILISDYKMEEARKKMFLGLLGTEFERILDFENRKRWGREIFSKEGKKIEAEDKGFVEINVFGSFGDSNYEKIKTEQRGYVTDISIMDLKRLIKYIKSLVEKNFPDPLYRTLETEIQPGPLLERKLPVVYITSQFLENSEEGEVLHVSKKIFSEDEDEKEHEVGQLRALSKKAFTIEEQPDIAKVAGFELSKLKDRFIGAIKREKLRDLAKLEETYLALARAFIGIMKTSYGGGFSPTQAKAERTSLFDRLKPAEWLRKDVGDIFSFAMTEGSFEVVKALDYLPTKLASIGIENDDHLLFQNFIGLHKNLYGYGSRRKDGDAEVVKFMKDRVWRYLEELSDYRLRLKFKESKGSDDNCRGFYDYIISTFQDLVKEAFDNRDLNSFKVFLEKLHSLFEALSIYNLADEEKTETLEGLKQKRREVVYGLSSWVLFKYHTDPELKDYFDAIKVYLPSDIEDLTKLFLAVHTFEKVESFGWDNWEREGREDIFELHTLAKLEALYAVQGLILLASKTTDQIKDIALEYNRGLANLAGGSRDLFEIFAEIETSSTGWAPLLDEEAIKRTADFKRLLEDMKEKQERADLERRREGRISDDRVEEFKKGVTESFNESDGIRNILKFYGLYKDNSDGVSLKDNIERIGIKTFFDKSPFLDEGIEPNIIVPNVESGFGFGDSLIRGENSKIVEIIKDKLEEREENTKIVGIIKNKLEERGENLKKILRPINDLEDIIIIGLNGAAWKLLKQAWESGEYLQSRQLGNKDGKPNEQIGQYEFEKAKIPVYEIYDNTKEGGVMILHTKSLGRLIQRTPLETGQGTNADHILHISVKESTEDSEEMKRFKNNPPDWFKQIGSEEEQNYYLQERVLIEVFEQFEFVLDENFRGFYLKVE